MTSPTGPEQAAVPTDFIPDNIGEKMVRQIRQANRWYDADNIKFQEKYPGGASQMEEEGYPSREKRWRRAPLPTIADGGHPGLPSKYKVPSVSGVAAGEVPEWLDIPNKLIGRVGPKEGLNPLNYADLYRAYKHTPHQPASMFLKYLIHRTNHFDEYANPEAGHKLDREFLNLVQTGGAAEKNGHVSIGDLHDWTNLHAARVMPELLAERARIHGELLKGIGNNVRYINGEPHVALTRGLNDDIMNREHPLSSHADKPETGFGRIMHHAWVPLRDVWYSYDLGPERSSGNMGPEDEWLVSNKHPRYEAKPDDVQSMHESFRDSHGKGEPLYAGMTDEQLAALVPKVSSRGVLPHGLATHPNAGPATWQAFKDAGLRDNMYLIHKFAPREEALANAQGSTGWHAFANPNLTAEDLVSLADYLPKKQFPGDAARFLVSHPRMNSHVLEQVWQKLKPFYPLDPGWSDSSQQPLIVAAASPLATPAMLEEATKMALAVGYTPMAEAVVKNPHHTPAQAAVLMRMAIGNKTDRYRKMAEHAKLNPETIDEWTKAVPDYAHANALGSWAIANPHADEYLPEAIRRSQVTMNQMGERITHFGTLSPSVQRAILQKWGLHEDNWLMAQMATMKGLVPDVIAALANSSSSAVRTNLWHSKQVTPEQLEEAFPKGKTFWEPGKTSEQGERIAPFVEKPSTSYYTYGDPLYQFRQAIEDRKQYRDRRGREHLIKPFPANLAKSEWGSHLRSWLSKLKGKHGYHFPTTREHAIQAIRDGYIAPQFTDEILDGRAVFANRASPTFLTGWHKTSKPEDAVLYFETESDPETHVDGRPYWTGVVPIHDAHVAAMHDEGDAPLAKMHPPILFPRLGIGDDRRETIPVSTTQQRKLAGKVATNLAFQDPPDPEDDRAVTEAKMGRAFTGSHGFTISNLGHAASDRAAKLDPESGKGTMSQSYVKAGRQVSPEVKKLDPIEQGRFVQATSHHEDLHQVFQRVKRRYGKLASKQLARNVLASIPNDDRKLHGAIRDYLDFKLGGYYDQEEAIAQTSSYLNNAFDRDKFHRVRQHSSEKQREFQTRMKQAYEHMRAAAETADEGWLQKEKPWERGLVKMHTPFTFPKLGVPEDRRETPYAKGKRSQRQKLISVLHADTGKDKKTTPQVHREAKRLLKDPDFYGLAAESPSHVGYVTPTKSGQSDIIHENMHQMLGRVQEKFGPEGRKTLVRNLMATLPQQQYRDVLKLANAFSPGSTKPTNDVHEENLTYVLSYLNHPTWRLRYHRGEGHSPGEKLRFHMSIKRAHNIMRAAGEVAGPTWAQVDRPWEQQPQQPQQEQPLAASEETHLEPLLPGTGSGLEDWHHDIAALMLGHDERAAEALAAAEFLTGRRVKPDMDKFQVALRLYDGDHQRAALYAVGLKDSPENLRALDAALKLGDFEEMSKAEVGDTSPAIQSVQPGAPDAEDAADMVRRAVSSGTIESLKLTGKHSSGAMVLRDPKTGAVKLLKPGSGKQSPAAGAREDKSSQSAREAAFWHVANGAFGLGGVVPRADLLIVNAQEWACLTFLAGSDWATLDEENRKLEGYGRETLQPYLVRGDCHRWAVLDGVLGNVDRHGMNLMVGPSDSVALIDHGSAFAGEHFDPGHDEKSFIPYYLRVWAPKGFSKMDVGERMKHMPRLDETTDRDLRKWLLDVNPPVVQGIMDRYGIGPEGQKAVMSRLNKLQRYDGPSLSAFINGLWAGVAPW